MPRECLSRLTYSQFDELSVRLTEMSDASRNPGYRAALHQASLAASDLVSIKFAISEHIAMIAEFIAGDHALEDHKNMLDAVRNDLLRLVQP